MGTRSAAKIKLRKAPYKCEICGRRLMSAESLKSHQLCLHNLAVKVKTKRVPTKQSVNKSKIQLQSPKLKNDKLIVKTKAALKKLHVSNKSVNKTPIKSTVKPAVKTNSDRVSVKSEYECPKCSKIFPIYFSAHRHIQKIHCVNSAGDKVSPNSPQLIKPIERKICSTCNKELTTPDSHTCEAVQAEQDDLGQDVNYVCSGCKEQFFNLRLFDNHVAGLHCKGVESMYFPNSEVFQTWKNEMEEQTKVKYSVLGKYDFKKIYRCTNLPEKNAEYDDITSSYLCPSGIVVQEFSKGTQVHYYKDHYGHDCGSYVLSEKYKKYGINTLMRKSSAYAYTELDGLKVDQKDLHLQLKQLMECIVLDAANSNVDTLKALIGKALDMTSVLNNTEDNPDPDTVETRRIIENSVMVDGGGDKRKIDTDTDKPKTEPITKRFKTRINQLNPNNDKPTNVPSVLPLQDTSIKIINSFSLADQDISEIVNEVDSDENVPDPLFKEDNGGDREVVSKSMNEDELNSNDEAENMELSPTSFDGSYRNIFAKSSQTENSPFKIKGKSKQRKLLSPKDQNSTKESTRQKKSMKHMKADRASSQTRTGLSAESVTIPIDYKYEVKERENDCNILILKI